MACCAMDNAWLAVASARAATAHASQGGGGAAQAPSNSNGVPSARTRANVIELFRVSLVIPYLPSKGGDHPSGGGAPWLRRKPAPNWRVGAVPMSPCVQPDTLGKVPVIQLKSETLDEGPAALLGEQPCSISGMGGSAAAAQLSDRTFT